MIRGPASAVWGANALNGVINVITKTPRENAWHNGDVRRRRLQPRGRRQRRVVGLAVLRARRARAGGQRPLGVQGLGRHVQSDAFARPVGVVPNGPARRRIRRTRTRARRSPSSTCAFDYDFPDGERKLQFSGGSAGPTGIMHTGIGPFDIQSGTAMSYGKFNFTKRAFKLQAFLNVLDGDAANLVSVDQAGVPIGLIFDTKTFDVEVGDTRILGARSTC